jgi:transcriptional regulator with XRE-family HTH domain
LESCQYPKESFSVFLIDYFSLLVYNNCVNLNKEEHIMSEEKAKEIFAKNLNYFLELNGKKQIDLAKHLDCSTGLVSAWCSGRKMPRSERVKAIADWLHVKMSDLVDDKHELQEEGYYLNEETKRIAQAIYDNPDMRSLFDMSSKMTPERLKAHLEFMKKLQDSETQ